MSDTGEARRYELSGVLVPEQWSRLEMTMHRMGMMLVPVAEEDAEEAGPVYSGLTRKSFHGIAEAAGQTRQVAGRAWNVLAMLYSYRFFDDPDSVSCVPDSFRWRMPDWLRYPQLEYNVVPKARPRDTMVSFARRLDFLQQASLHKFVDQMDEGIESAGDVMSVGFPDYFGGKKMIEFLHVATNS